MQVLEVKTQPFRNPLNASIQPFRTPIAKELCLKAQSCGYESIAVFKPYLEFYCKYFVFRTSYPEATLQVFICEPSHLEASLK